MRPDEDGWALKWRHVRYRADEPWPDEVVREGGRALLAMLRNHGLRLGEGIVPLVEESLRRVRSRLQIDVDVHLFILPRPDMNAFAGSVGGTPVVAMHAGLVERLGPCGLDFVVAHELGHVAMGHCMVEDEQACAELDAQQMMRRRRMAEISADRMGLMGCLDLTGAIHAMIKIASGLSWEFIRPDVESFIAQVDHGDDLDRQWHEHQSHPSLPLRVRALIAFGRGDPYRRASSNARGRQMNEVDDEVEAMLLAMGDATLGQREDEAVHRALRWCAAALVLDDGLVEAAEVQAMHELVGVQETGRIIEFAKMAGRDEVLARAVEAWRGVALTSDAVERRLRSGLEGLAIRIGVPLADSQLVQVLRHRSEAAQQ